MNRKFLIFTPSYNENSGGIVVLHKLCHVLNELGHDSYLKPYFYSYELRKNNWRSFLFKWMKWSLLSSFRCFKTNPVFNTPIFNGDKVDSSWIVIYPEVVFGNPMEAENVVRWLLHQPGFHEGDIYYGKNELYFKFNSAINDFQYLNSKISKNELKVIHYPLEYYNLESVPNERVGTAYCLRKGRNKKIVHDLSDSILIDGKSHAEVAKILKQVKRFISYDTLTAYSIFAVLCGCESVVIPDDGVPEDEWYPNITDRYGISYGLDENKIIESTKTACLVREHIMNEQLKAIKNVEVFVAEADDFFKASIVYINS